MRGYAAMTSFLAAALFYLARAWFDGSIGRIALWAAITLTAAGVSLLLTGPKSAAQSPASSLEAKLDRALKRRMDLEAQLKAVDDKLEQLCRQVDGQAAGMLKSQSSH
jgi:peptidoglycan hydrolase CwlO-like protein